ncbi:MAG: hypothetical protein ACLFNR_00475 [Candidatus Paceibacterota bacterium]
MEIRKQRSFLSDLTPSAKIFLGLLLATMLVTTFFLFSEQNEDDEEIPQDPEEEEEEEEEIEENEDQEEEADESEDESTEYDDKVTVEDQKAGNTVKISELSLSEDRWVVVREDREGELGNILGAKLFSKDDTEGQMELLRETEAEKEYNVILYMVAEREKDRDRRFDTARDMPLIEEEGETESVSFKALPQ